MDNLIAVNEELRNHSRYGLIYQDSIERSYYWYSEFLKASEINYSLQRKYIKDFNGEKIYAGFYSLPCCLDLFKSWTRSREQIRNIRYGLDYKELVNRRDELKKHPKYSLYYNKLEECILYWCKKTQGLRLKNDELECKIELEKQGV
jgi:hypothetical protein